MTKEHLATWELFLEEILRNIKPKKEEIEESFNFLLEAKACSKKRYDAMVAVRYMAAFEQAINEYLHPPKDFKQANIKAEIIHFGSLFESLTEIFLAYLYKNQKFSIDDYNSWFPDTKTINLKLKKEISLIKETISKKGKKTSQIFSFKMTIDCLKKWNENLNSKNNNFKKFKDFLSVVDNLRNERNKVHIDKMVKEDIRHEEHNLVEVREKWDRFLKLIEKILKE